MEVSVVSADEFVSWGCPYCGYAYSAQMLTHEPSGACINHCVNCGEGFIVVPEGMNQAPFSIDGRSFTLMQHPRQGIPHWNLQTEGN